MRSGEVLKEKTCVRCKKTVNARLVRNITTSGISQVYWQCAECSYNVEGPAHFIKHDLLRQYVIIDSLPVVNDYSKTEKCAVIGCTSSSGVEWHHFGPVHLFHDEADNWPGAYLCRMHHALWHKLVTPNMCEVR